MSDHVEKDDDNSVEDNPTQKDKSKNDNLLRKRIEDLMDKKRLKKLLEDSDHWDL